MDWSGKEISGPWEFWKDDDLCIFCGAYVDEDANEDCTRSWIHRCDGKTVVPVEKRWIDDKEES